ncbi:MAG: LdpA C-terminal domain-containing domain [bacterium]
MKTTSKKDTGYSCNIAMDRYSKLRDILQERRFFKLVCGAGNEDQEEVRRLSLIFTLAGSTMLDLSANTDVVDAAAAGIKKAYEIAPLLDKKIEVKPYLNVSIGLKGDPHVRKVKIDQARCDKCGRCIDSCKQGVISDDFTTREYRCIGCGHCEVACLQGAIGYVHRRADIEKILPLCIQRGVETMELHAATDDDEAFLSDWKTLTNLIPDNFISLCIDRSLLSNKHLIERARLAYQLAGERLIIQADGIPMSGSEKDDYNNTLQAVACADIIQKSGIPAMILLSGGTNSKTGLLSRECAVGAHGVAVGTFARMLVKEYLKKEEFDTDIAIINEAVLKAEALIKSNIEAIRG